MNEEKHGEPELEGGGHTWWYVCPECHIYVDEKDDVCPCCKLKLDWKVWKDFSQKLHRS